MSVALYMDVQVPRAITTGLRLRGVDVITAQEAVGEELGPAAEGCGELSAALGEIVLRRFRRIAARDDPHFVLRRLDDLRDNSEVVPL